MRFVTFEHQGQARAGVLVPHAAGRAASLIDGAHPARPMPLRQLSPSMTAWIEFGLVELSVALKDSAPEQECLLPLSAVRLLAPLPCPGKIVGAAFNYRDGLAASSRPAPDQPVIFIKSRSTVIGPDEPIHLAAGNQVTYEAELAAIIGRPALKTSTDAASAHVCGYAIFNDVSYTNMVRDDGGFVRGKNQPTTGPLGPWIVSADDIVDPHDLAIELEIDGVALQSSSTSQMLFRIDELVAYASAQMPLDPGDVIATGTPAGVAANHQPAAWLRHGQRTTLRISELGELSNPVVET
ncbi:fumarylacetoacetate hydrolase family protein [Bordetella sp. BOR01]|uniref:fumarylacetoacetate hydrolase family protein n=1 Tax=Bordetella sp. BOR01 TaxID=2854779 RepID=UPI001C495785|nr:fumarylacetoacetate hydrolase family protein [Bordetella sp. BOR01]MBV7483356.1 fumarylacetoacetate hydrolase family protein [Bordetella sp. BOR01]